jgi:hypothetical protein
MKNRYITFATILLALGFLALSPTPKAFGVNPPPDGGYPGFTTAEGTNALKNLTTGAGNTGVGWFSLFTASTANFNTGVGAGTLTLNTGDNNTAMGAVALFLNTTGGNNTAVGTSALLHNDDAFNNTAVGAFALNANTVGNANTAIGGGALGSNTDGGGNTAVGVLALSANLHGPLNTAIGLAALQNDIEGVGNNTAIGAGALNQNSSGFFNTAVGSGALSSNDDGGGNDAFGFNALSSHTNGGFNTAIGSNALLNDTIGQANVAVGNSALQNSTGPGGNIALGASAGVNVELADHVICIGNPGLDVSDSCYIGQIFGRSVDFGTGTAVFVDSDGKLGTQLSSRRFKRDIEPMDKASEAILALKPVTFHYKSDAKNTPCFGLIAEEVAEVNPELVLRNKNGEILSVRYDQVNAMLLNEFLKAHREVEELEKGMAALTTQLKEQAAQIQKVSAQLEVNRPAPKVVKAP